MPQDSISPAPDLPSVDDLAMEAELEPIDDWDHGVPIQRHVIVERLLRDLVLFAQDFDDAVDELAEEPIVQPQIFFPRPQRPAGRFMLGAGRRNPNRRPPPRPDFHYRWGNRYQRHHFLQNPRPGDVPLRPAGLLGRPANPQGNFGEQARPGQQPFYVLGGPDDVYQGPPAIGDVEPDRQVAVEVEPRGPAAAEAEPGVQADAELEPGRYADAEEEIGLQGVEGAESDMVGAQAAMPGVAGNAAAESDTVGDAAAKPKVTGNAEESDMEKTAEAESNMVANSEPGMAAEAAEAESDMVSKAEPDIAAEAESDMVAKAEPDIAAEAESDMVAKAKPDIAAAEAESDMVAKAEPDIAAAEAESDMVAKAEPDIASAEAKSDMAEKAEVDLGRSTDVKPETCSPVTVEESELVRTDIVEGQLDTPTTSGAETTKVLAKGTEVVGSAATSESTSMPVPIVPEYPLPVKRARLHSTEAVCSEQFEDDSDDKTAEESSKPEGEN